MKNMGFKSKKLIKDFVAVSPVIAVILMVAVLSLAQLEICRAVLLWH